MRTLRLSLTGTVIVALLGGLGAAAVAAQSDEGIVGDVSPATYVTGTRTFTEYVGEPTSTMVGGVEQSCDWRADYGIEMSDPRVSGTFTLFGHHVDMHGAGLPDTDAGQGPVQLVNAGGTRSGTWSRAYHRTSGTHTYVWLVGDGAYEGLTFWTSHCSEQTGSMREVPIEGVIIESTAPPMP